MWFSVVEVPDGDDVVLSVTGDLDLSSVPSFRRAIRRLEAPAGRVVVDLTGVDLLDSAGIGLLVGARLRVRREGSSLIVRCREGRVAELLRATEVADLLGLEIVEG